MVKIKQNYALRNSTSSLSRAVTVSQIETLNLLAEDMLHWPDWCEFMYEDT